MRLARSGDGAAFRLLVERYRGMARARAARLSAYPDDVEDIVQEAFLQAFTGLGRLREPDRFGGWLAGIVRNVSRAMSRRDSPVLLGDWPELLHPASAGGLPSAEDLDRAQVLGAAVAGLPAGQRRAVELYYYADLPVGQIGGSPGAAKASLHKARRRLREYVTARRPDLVPAASRRIPMITVRIARAQPQLAQPADGGAALGPVLVVLADDAGGRVLPLRLSGMAGYALSRVLEQPSAEPSGVPGDIPPGQTAAGALIAADLASRLLGAAAVPVTGVDIDELGPDVPVARITVRGLGGPGQVMVRAGIGLALAALTGAPVRVADALMDRLAVPAAGDDLAALFPGQVPAGPTGLLPGPRNLDFSHGLDGWVTGGSFRTRPTPAHWQDYAATARDGAAVLRSAVPAPQGEIVLGQAVAATDYRGAAVTFRGELRADEVTGRAGLFVFVVTGDGRPGPDTDVTGPAITGSRDWAAQELTVQVPGDAELIRIGLSLAGPGQVALRNTLLTRAR